MSAIALFVSSQLAFAQTATQVINLSANVADFCSIAGAASAGPVSRVITVTNGNVSTGALPVVSVGSVACTKASDLTLTSSNQGLTGPGVTAGFENVIHYTATASFDGAAPSLDTSTAAVDTDATSGAASGTMTVNITPQANLLPVMVGIYGDTLTVTLTPQP